MAVAVVEDGKIVESTSAASIAQGANKNKTSNSTVDKDQFLQLLVAQMKYQDPLEPTSNTEYISQYATFSELEQMQNMSASLELSRASALVGQTVLMKVTDSSGNTTTVQGNVDYVVYENNKAYLSINGELYSMDSLDTVADPEYLDAYKIAADFLNAYNKLPVVGVLTIDDKDAVMKVKETYDNMSEYQKKFISQDYVSGLEKYVARMNDLIKAAEEENKTSGSEENSTEDTEKKEDSETTDDTQKTE
ncbi:MAG: flagellar hook capping FlgD N-terminal domain-containing protein [Lachnospiraceae bacterium]|nr:flagellar hook capping FlgD N-terminal domain-containing protein [Lachnospiraceae bacterium]